MGHPVTARTDEGLSYFPLPFFTPKEEMNSNFGQEHTMGHGTSQGCFSILGRLSFGGLTQDHFKHI